VNSRCALLFYYKRKSNVVFYKSTVFVHESSLTSNLSHTTVISAAAGRTLFYRPLHCPSGHTPYCHGNFPTPMSLNRDTTQPGRKKSRLDRVMSSTFWGDGAQLDDADAASMLPWTSSPSRRWRRRWSRHVETTSPAHHRRIATHTTTHLISASFLNQALVSAARLHLTPFPATPHWSPAWTQCCQGLDYPIQHT